MHVSLIYLFNPLPPPHQPSIPSSLDIICIYFVALANVKPFVYFCSLDSIFNYEISD